jgi:phytanoyl-CoA hydroxylase
VLEFDEAFYLQQHPDVAEAVRRGEWPSGLTHYCVAGKAKGRPAAPPIDGAWYLRTYPLVAGEIAAGKAASADEHFHRVGKFRGYLPTAEAARPDNPAATCSRFGGLWTDVGNALDIVAGRLEIGQINAEQAALLRKWITDGYVILPGAVDDDVLERAQQELDRAYRGEMPNLRFAVHGVHQNTAWVPEALAQPAKALDLHWFSQPIRELIFADKLLAFLHLIFERRALASQTLGFWRGSAQEGHQDSAYVNYSLPMQFAASWIALEDVQAGAGELFYHRGSHRMPDFLYAKHFKGAEEAKRVRPGVNLDKDYPRHIELIRRQAEGLGLETERFMARRGDVLVWSADLAHGGGAISGQQTRKSVVTHYCPAEVVPSYFEKGKRCSIVQHGHLAYYSSDQY